MSTTSFQSACPSLTVADAINRALTEEMRRDPRVLMFGEGVATKRRALVDEFGGARVRNTPLAEGIVAGTAAGAAAMGLRPVVDLLFAPFLTLAMDALVNSAGKLRYLSGGQFRFPMVVMTMNGAGWAVGGQHNHNLEAMFVHAPGLKVVMPSTAADALGLLKASIRDSNPVLFFTDLAQSFDAGDVPEGEHLVPIGKAAVRRRGPDVTLVSYAKTVAECVQAAHTLARGRRGRGHRPAEPEAARHRHRARLGAQDRPAGGGARGRGAVRGGRGGGGAGRRAGVCVVEGAGAASRRAGRACGGVVGARASRRAPRGGDRRGGAAGACR